jgi:hypothetical protein
MPRSREGDTEDGVARQNAGDGVRILFGGDATSIGRTEGLLREGRFSELWNDAREVVVQHDYALCNLESPLSDQGSPIAKVGPHLRGRPEFARLLKEWGFAAVSLANNHVMDFGASALRETLEVCAEADLGVFGAGSDAAAAECAHRVEIRGQRISFIAGAEEEFSIAGKNRWGAASLDPVSMYYRIIRERDWADWVIVVFHGGNEYYALPRPGLQKLCRFLVSAGADVVVGHHPHVPGGYERWEGGLIAYSLGNLLFDGGASPREGWGSGLLLSTTLTPGEPPRAHWFPYVQWADGVSGVRLRAGQEEEGAIMTLEGLRKVIESPGAMEASWSQYCHRERNRAWVPFLALGRGRIIGKLVRAALTARLLPGHGWAMNVLNRVRCESHREHFLAAAEEELRRP